MLSGFKCMQQMRRGKTVQDHLAVAFAKIGGAAMPQQRIPAIDPGDGLGLLAALQDNAVTARQINARDGNIRMIEDVEQFPLDVVNRHAAGVVRALFHGFL